MRYKHNPNTWTCVPDEKPLVDDRFVYGEIAVNAAPQHERLYVKNFSDEIVEFYPGEKTGSKKSGKINVVWNKPIPRNPMPYNRYCFKQHTLKISLPYCLRQGESVDYTIDSQAYGTPFAIRNDNTNAINWDIIDHNKIRIKNMLPSEGDIFEVTGKMCIIFDVCELVPESRPVMVSINPSATTEYDISFSKYTIEPIKNFEKTYSPYITVDAAGPKCSKQCLQKSIADSELKESVDFPMDYGRFYSNKCQNSALKWYRKDNIRVRDRWHIWKTTPSGSRMRKRKFVNITNGDSFLRTGCLRRTVCCRWRHKGVDGNMLAPMIAAIQRGSEVIATENTNSALISLAKAAKWIPEKCTTLTKEHVSSLAHIYGYPIYGETITVDGTTFVNPTYTLYYLEDGNDEPISTEVKFFYPSFFVGNEEEGIFRNVAMNDLEKPTFQRLTVSDGVNTLDMTDFDPSEWEINWGDVDYNVNAQVFNGANHLSLSDFNEFSNFESVTKMDPGMFAGGRLTNITTPYSLTEIGESAFACCRYLVNVAIYGGVRTFTPYMLADCTSLTQITIPSSVTAVFGGCFLRDNALSEIISNASTEPAIYDTPSPFLGVATGGVLYTPYGSYYGVWMSNGHLGGNGWTSSHF